MKHILLALGLALLAAAAAPADDVHSKPLTLHPPAPAARALEYALMPELKDATPGNAADHYRQAIKNSMADAPSFSDYDPFKERWLDMPLKELPREDVGKFLRAFESTFRELEAGARSEQCDWGLTEELRKHGIRTPISDDIVVLHELAGVLALRVRFQLAEGRPDQAARTLQTGFAMARHVADAPVLIFARVGMWISAVMLNRLEEFVQQPGAPDLYWPLTDLPSPLFDMRKPLQGRRVVAYGSFPGLSETAENLTIKPWTPDQVGRAVELLRSFSPQPNAILEIRQEAEMALRIAARHEADRKALLDEGRPQELVDAMPHVQVAVMASFREFDAAFDEMEKDQSVPFWEAQPAMERLKERCLRQVNDRNGPAIPAAWMFLAGWQDFETRAQVNRRVAVLRCVEAVRLYAAGHDGKFPASLDDVTDVPIPVDPVTGKPFDYHLAGDRAYLSSTPFPGPPADNANTPTYELIFNR